MTKKAEHGLGAAGLIILCAAFCFAWFIFAGITGYVSNRHQDKLRRNKEQHEADMAKYNPKPRAPHKANVRGYTMHY